MIIDPRKIPVNKMQEWMNYAVSPRPIALVSTIDPDGLVNLAPFSYFNMFSADPPIVIFSPLRRVRDNSAKHTLDNVHEIMQCVVHICDEQMIHQVNLASAEFEKGINEFEKAGFTPVKSELVLPPR